MGSRVKTIVSIGRLVTVGFDSTAAIAGLIAGIGGGAASDGGAATATGWLAIGLLSLS